MMGRRQAMTEADCISESMGWRCSGRSSSSASITRTQAPVAWRRASLRAAEKSSFQAREWTVALNCLAISTVRSVEPVSTTTIWAAISRTEARHWARNFSSFFVIRQTERRGADLVCEFAIAGGRTSQSCLLLPRRLPLRNCLAGFHSGASVRAYWAQCRAETESPAAWAISARSRAASGWNGRALMAEMVEAQAAPSFFFLSNSRASARWPRRAQGGRTSGAGLRASLGAVLTGTTWAGRASDRFTLSDRPGGADNGTG